MLETRISLLGTVRHFYIVYRGCFWTLQVFCFFTASFWPLTVPPQEVRENQTRSHITLYPLLFTHFAVGWWSLYCKALRFANLCSLFLKYFPKWFDIFDQSPPPPTKQFCQPLPSGARFPFFQNCHVAWHSVRHASYCDQEDTFLVSAHFDFDCQMPFIQTGTEFFSTVSGVRRLQRGVALLVAGSHQKTILAKAWFGCWECDNFIWAAALTSALWLLYNSV